MTKLIIVSDGASHNNGDECGAAFMVYDEKGNVQHSQAEAIGKGSNTQAEYQAMINAVVWAIGAAQEKSADQELAITFLTDSNLVVSHVNGVFVPKTPHTQRWLAELQSNLDELGGWVKEVVIEHAPREYTQAVDSLARNIVKETVEKNFEKKYSFLKK